MGDPGVGEAGGEADEHVGGYVDRVEGSKVGEEVGSDESRS